jgi:hypothetical protein
MATVEAAAAEVAEAPSSDPQPTQEDEPEVVYGRHLLPKPAKVPFSRLMVKGQRVMEEIEEGLRQDWEELEAERLQLSDWEHRLGERIETVTSRYAEEQAQLEQEHDDMQEQMRRTLNREAAIARQEKAAAQWEKVLIKRELMMEERSKATRDMVNHAKAALKLIEEQRADLEERELAVAKEKSSLTGYRVDLATRA